MQYVHLHNHTEFSLLDGAAKIEDMLAKACDCGMSHVGISDHGNLYGVPKFVLTARKKGLKPVIGSEFYLCENHQDRIPRSGRDSTGEKGLYHQILFAKNETGYKNLIKLSSISFTEGYYYKPRIDKQLLQQYSEGLIATTCCLASEINQKIMAGKLPEAEAVFRWYLDLFGKDYYVEIQRHGLKDQDLCNEVLLKWAKQYNVPVIATNDVHYVNEEDSEAHDLLLALQTGADYADPNRFRFTDDTGELNRSFYFKTPAEMQVLFSDQPAALENTLQLAESCTFDLNLKGDLFLPTYKVPTEYPDMNAYLAHLAWIGARKKYGDPLPDAVSERIQHELKVIAKMGFEGYFLIVQEFTNEARRRGVMVGPGRGSAAGSVVAFVIGITDIDPMQYALLFERFLNPERVSPPDIDIDFDDEGRAAVIDFVVEKYGRQSVSQIITYGTMGAKTAVRDVGRVLGIPLPEVNRIAKYIPEGAGWDFDRALKGDENPDGASGLQEAFGSPDPRIQQMMRYARTLEGSARHTGIHAAGVIIAPGDISNYVPVAINNSKEKIVTTQYDGPNAELAGMLKMDFLGLRTLSIIKSAIRNVKESQGIDIHIDDVPLTDEKTYALYQAGDTVATFQFESDGMRKYLKQLKPTTIEDLIAMNALYRPGPMDNIPSFIDRKQGREPITYPHPLLEPILANTYGIMVYQEQIMEVARVIGGYTLGGADLLRRAMGKKKKEVMEAERAKFIQGAIDTNGLSAELAGEIFDTMEKFASYGFNKSHSAAYSLVAYRTAYLKANYPAEYMAAVLSHNQDSIEKISFFIEECRRMGMPVLPPDVNESALQFAVRQLPDGKPCIRFGLGAIKGIGTAAAEGILAERAENGPFSSVFDLCARVNSLFVNKRVLESLAYAGALDGFGLARWAYFVDERGEGQNVLDQAVRYGQSFQQEKNSNQTSLFGGGSENSPAATQPKLPNDKDRMLQERFAWPLIQQLNQERDVIGFYLSGHPLDKYRKELDAFATCSIAQLPEYKKHPKRDAMRVGGIITSVRERLTKNGAKFGIYTLEDFSGAIEISLFSNDYAKFSGFFQVDNCVLLQGKYQPRFGQDEENYELKVTDVKMLDSVRAEMTKEIHIDLSLPEVQPSLIEALAAGFAQHKGKVAVKFRIHDNTLPQPLTLAAHQVHIQPTDEILQTLERFQLNYRLLGGRA